MEDCDRSDRSLELFQRNNFVLACAAPKLGDASRDSRFTAVTRSGNKVALLLFRHKTVRADIKVPFFSVLLLISTQPVSDSISPPATVERVLFLDSCLFAVSMRSLSKATGNISKWEMSDMSILWPDPRLRCVGSAAT